MPAKDIIFQRSQVIVHCHPQLLDNGMPPFKTHQNLAEKYFHLKIQWATKLHKFTKKLKDSFHDKICLYQICRVQEENNE